MAGCGDACHTAALALAQQEQIFLIYDIQCLDVLNHVLRSSRSVKMDISSAARHLLWTQDDLDVRAVLFGRGRSDYHLRMV